MILPENIPNKEYLEKIIAHSRDNKYLWRELNEERGSPAFGDAHGHLIENYSVFYRLVAPISNEITGVEGTNLDCVVALIAYPDCGYLLDSDPGEVALLAAFGNSKAQLLLNACRILHGIRAIVD